MIGLLLGPAVRSCSSPSTPAASSASWPFSVLVGLLFGALIGALNIPTTQQGRRDFSSEVKGRVPTATRCRSTPGYADVAEQMLAGMPAS